MLQTSSYVDYSAIFDELFPICRSITGAGLRRSLDIVSDYMPLKRYSVPSGTMVFDWTVPPEWNIRGASISGPDGATIVDMADNNLHVVNYSEPVDAVMPLEELQAHLHSIPNHPDLIPYVTSYYKKQWGFCLYHKAREALKDGLYRVHIDSDLAPGAVDYAMTELPGERKDFVLLSSYLCHPSMANNELSGPLILIGLYQRIKAWARRRFTYRFLLNPETIGSLCFLHNHGDELKNGIVSGLVLTCLGGPNSHLSFKTSRQGDSPFDNLARHLAKHGSPLEIREFTPVGGSDERQYCSPGFNLPVSQFARTVYGQYHEYHTSGDDKEFMDIEQIRASVDEIEQFLWLSENSGRFLNLAPFGEPQLGKRNLYPNINSPLNRHYSNDDQPDQRTLLNLILFALNYSDGTHSMIDIAEKAGCGLETLVPVIHALESEKLLRHQGI